ncbi:hypothetical protein MTR67_044517 [Solanum verrucosum]|uniref:Uncharacterized protein n=1 Tax=Solanum verrucosum TaxID=315347 RepID=A0AAF0URQ0_SOLVR|nr:hypothetical protein MTR67_044517 [Solanum verrucosum]
MSINGSLPLPADEEVNFHDLLLVLLLDAPSEGEVSKHVSFRVAQDGFTNWSFSRRRLKNVNGDSVSNPMSEPSSPTNIPSLPTVRVPQTRQKCRQVEADLISALAARKRSRSSACNPLQTPAIVLSDHDLVSSRDRCSKHITSKPSSYKSKPSTKAKKSSLPKPFPKPASKTYFSMQSTSKSKKKQVASPVSSSSQLNRIIHFHQQYVLRGQAFDVPVQVWHSQTVKDVVGQVNHMALLTFMRRLDTPLQHLKNQFAEKENELTGMMSDHQIEKETWEARVVMHQNELAQ